MSQGIPIQNHDHRKSKETDSEKLKRMKDEATHIRERLEAGEISQSEAVKRLNKLIGEGRSLLERLLDL